MSNGEIVGGLRRLYKRLREQDAHHTDALWAELGADKIEQLEARLALCMDLLMQESDQ